MSDRRELRRQTFDCAAASYQRARPTYPEALFDDLVELAQLTPGDRLLEIGCATGVATMPLLHRGFRVVCVELGTSLAALARDNVAGLPAEVHVAAFEDWEGEAGGFELVYAATAWAWVDPATRYRKAHQLLRPGGHLAFWNAMHAFPAGFDPFFSEIQAVYDAIGESFPGSWPPPVPAEVSDETAEIEASGLFEAASVRRYLWSTSYTADEYISLLDTFSGHIAMGEAKREQLYEEIRRTASDRPDGRIQRHWHSILHVARAVGDGGCER